MPWPRGTLIEPIQALTEKYPKVRLRLSSELTGELFKPAPSRVTSTLLPCCCPKVKAAPPPLLTDIIARDRMEIVSRRRRQRLTVIGKAWAEHLGCSIRRGCFLRASLIDRMERAGFTPMIAAEVHNMHMQLAFVPVRLWCRAATPLALLPGIILSIP